MRERQSRRTFIGVGLGCAAPLLLGTPLAEAASSVFTGQTGAKSNDPVLAHLRREALQAYRRARASVDETGRIPGEHLRALGANIGLAQAYLAGKGDDVRADESLRLRVGRDGRDAVVLKLTDGYRGLRENLKAQDRVILPAEPDFASAGAALDFLQQAGVRRTTRLLRQWALHQAARADRADGRMTRIPVVLGQKPGDDFLGYSEAEIDDITCHDVSLMVDSIMLAAALFVITGQIALAELFGVVGASAQLAMDITCG